MLQEEHGRLDLGVVARVVAREQRDGGAVERLEPGGGVRDPLPREERDELREPRDPEPPAQRRPVAAVLAVEAGARDDVRLVARERREELRQLGRVVLSVAVEAHGEVVALLERVAEPRLDGRADPEVEGKADDDRAGGGSSLGSPVTRAVVDDDDVDAGIELPDSRDDRADRLLLVEGGDDRDDPPAHAGTAVSSSSSRSIRRARCA